jgi:hypothetical protein
MDLPATRPDPAMSDKVQGWVWDLDLPPARKLVLLWLAGRATDNGVAFPGEREIRQRTGLGERMVRYHLQWLASDRDDNGQPKQSLIVRLERRIASQRNTSNVYVLAVPWQKPDAVRRDLEELRHVSIAALDRALAGVGATHCPQVSGGNPLPPVGEAHCPEVGAPGCRPEQSRVNSHREPTRTSRQAARPQQGDAIEHSLQPAGADPVRQRLAEALIDAFYRGLGADAGHVTEPVRKRDLAIARQLVAVGATPREAEAYARDVSTTGGRIAPIDLRSFERERLGWRARRRGMEQGQRQLVDRTGQAPTWQDASQTASVPRDLGTGTCESATPESVTVDTNGDRLRLLMRRATRGTR